jgi:LuxR family maltose regulon positive regulatory protein
MTSASSIVVLAAPAGYGKTTLLAQWAMRDERPFAGCRSIRATTIRSFCCGTAIALDGVEPIDRLHWMRLFPGPDHLEGRLCRALAAAIASLGAPP